MTYANIGKAVGLSRGQVAGRIKRIKDRLKNAGVDFPTEIENYPESVEIREDGTQVSDRLILIAEEERKNPRRLLELHNYDPDMWVLVNAVDNLWHMSKGWRQGGGKELLYQSKITAKPNEALTLELVQTWFENYDDGARSKPAKPKQYSNDGDVLEAFISDLHKGNRPVSSAKTIEEKFRETILDIYARCKGKKFSKIVLVWGGDNAHFDTKRRTTTSGTQMTTNGQTLPEIYLDLIELLIWSIDLLSQIAPVELIFIPGNHDNIIGFTIVNAVKLYYKDNPNVTVDAEYKPRKARLFGVSLVGFAHGDMSKSNANSWLMAEFREEWGKAKYAEAHMAHFHSQETREKNGMIVRWFPTMTGEDEWHDDKAFIGSVKASVCSVWGLDYGLKEQWYINM